MAKTQDLTQDEVPAPVPVNPVEERGVVAVTDEERPCVGNESPIDDGRARLGRLFAHLKIAKIVFVDDKAELQTDAGAVIRVLAEKEEARNPLATFFPGVALTLDNDALQEQIAARLSELDAEGLAKLRSVLSAQSNDAAEREALGRLQDLLPNGTTAHLLTPQAWHDRREMLIGECTEKKRTLFLFDQELEVHDKNLGFTKGAEIIRDMAEKERAGFGTRWFCGMLTHTVGKDDEVAAWKGLAASEGLELRFFMPIAKTTLDDATAFYGSVYRTLVNTYCETMKGLASEAFTQALAAALDRFMDLDPIDFEHMVVKSSEEEGVAELDTLIRLHGIFQKDQVKAKILQQERADEFVAAARIVKDIANIGRALSDTNRKRLHELRREELYESDQLVNSYNDPLRNGDLFEIAKGDNLELWVLIAQPCDLMVRKDGKRAREENFKVAFLAPLLMSPLGEEIGTTDALNFSLQHYDHHGAQSAIIQFAGATPANLKVLDLVVFNKDGCCQLNLGSKPVFSFPSRSWEKRDAVLRKHFQAVEKEIERARNTHNDDVASLLAHAILPRGAPSRAFAEHGLYENRTFRYPIRRCGRVRDPLATSLLSAYSRFLARDAHGHDYSKEKKRGLLTK